MKTAGLRVELVTEAAKDMTYDGDVRRLDCQLCGLAAQYDRLNRLEGQVTYAITDSPLSPLAPSAKVQLEIVEADYSGFRSLSATLCLAMALAVATGARRGEGNDED